MDRTIKFYVNKYGLCAGLRRVFIFSLSMFFAVGLSAQGHKFDHKKFEASMEQYITSQASLTKKEAAAFFPLYREMLKKQRALLEQIQHYRHADTRNNAECARAISIMDKNDIEIKRLQKYYHAKFVKILPAGKVMKIIKAENKFHRMAFEKMAKRGFNHRK